MKNFVFYYIILILFLLSCTTSKNVINDDYFFYINQQKDKQINESRDNFFKEDQPSFSEKKESKDEEGNTYITNNYYNFDIDDYYDYSYAARIRRFHRPFIGFGYYDFYYTNLYWYTYDPLDWGISIYFCYHWWPYYYYYYYPSLIWTGFYEPPIIIIHPFYYYYYPYYPGYWYRYWHRYWHGYWDGYWHGYWHGYFDALCFNYYYNSFDRTFYGPLKDITTSGSNRGNYNSFISTYNNNYGNQIQNIQKPNLQEKPIIISNPNLIEKKPQIDKKPQFPSINENVGDEQITPKLTDETNKDNNQSKIPHKADKDFNELKIIDEQENTFEDRKQPPPKRIERDKNIPQPNKPPKNNFEPRPSNRYDRENEIEYRKPSHYNYNRSDNFMNQKPIQNQSQQNERQIKTGKEVNNFEQRRK